MDYQNETDKGDIRSSDGGFPYRAIEFAYNLISPWTKSDGSKRKSVEDKFPEIKIEIIR